MEKHLKFEGIEISGTINDFIEQLVGKGYVLETEPFGEGFKMASMRGAYEDYDGLCLVTISTNSDEVVNNIIVQGEDHYSVDNVLDDFEYFKTKAETYGFELNNELNDYFDEDDIDALRAGNLSKSVYYQRDSDMSKIMVTIQANDNDDTFHAALVLFDGINAENTKKAIKRLDDFLSIREENLAQLKSEHLIFCGIEMDGAIEDFVEELEGKGFHIDNEPQWIEDSEIACMHGPFLGEPCKLLLCSNTSGDIMRVIVDRRERKSFDSVKDEFYKLLNTYKKKYGEPTELEEELIDMSNPIHAIKIGKGRLGAFFRGGDNGSSVSLLVSVDEDSHYPHITISYADGINQNVDVEGDENTMDSNLDDIDMDDYYDDI